MRCNFQKKRKGQIYSVFGKCNIIWFLTFILLSIHVFFAVQTSSMGARIALYEEEIQNLERENENLSMSLIDSSSLTKLSGLSEELGFKKVESALYLQPGESFAKAR